MTAQRPTEGQDSGTGPDRAPGAVPVAARAMREGWFEMGPHGSERDTQEVTLVAGRSGPEWRWWMVAGGECIGDSGPAEDEPTAQRLADEALTRHALSLLPSEPAALLRAAGWRVRACLDCDGRGGRDVSAWYPAIAEVSNRCGGQAVRPVREECDPCRGLGVRFERVEVGDGEQW